MPMGNSKGITPAEIANYKTHAHIGQAHPLLGGGRNEGFNFHSYKVPSFRKFRRRSCHCDTCKELLVSTGWLCYCGRSLGATNKNAFETASCLAK